jgi:glycosyltransferase 2 family protein
MRKEIKEKTILFIKIAVSLLFFYILFTKFVDLKKVISSFSDIRVSLLLLCFFISLATLVIRAVRWKIITKYYKKEISFKDSVLFYLRGIYYGSITPAKAGEFIRGHSYAKKYKVSNAEGFASVFFERIYDILLPLVFVVVYFLFKDYFNFYSAISLSFFLVLFLWFFIVIVSKLLENKIRKIKFLKDLTMPKASIDYKIPLCGFLTLLTWLAYSSVALIILNSMNQTIPFYYLFFSICVASVAILIPVTLNGWGIREGTYVFLFSKFVEPSKSLLFSILFVLINTYFLALIGLILEFIQFRKGRKETFKNRKRKPRNKRKVS